jgi:methylglutamate dehydrogenase subunit D
MAERDVEVPPALSGLAAPGRHGRATGPAGVVVEERRGLGLATLSARRGQGPALQAACRSAFGLDPPPVGKRYAGADLALIGTGPGQWLAATEKAPADGIEALLRPALGTFAAVTDLSHARIVLRLQGPRVRDALAAGIPIDLHPRGFAAGAAAQTIVAHIGVLIWRTAGDGDPVHEIAVPRSMIGGFWHWLETASARHGLEVRDSRP